MANETLDHFWGAPVFKNDQDLSDFAVRARSDLDLHEFLHDPEWLSADADPGRERIITIARQQGQRVSGILVARQSLGSIPHSLGPIRLFRRPVLQLTVHQGPVCGTSGPCAPDALYTLSSTAPDAVIYLSAVPEGSVLKRSIDDRKSTLHTAFHVLPWGDAGTHFKIRWEGSLETYLTSLGSKGKRKNVRRAAQRLATEADVRVERFQSLVEAERFLDASKPVAAKTYQTVELGLGMTAAREKLIRLAATRSAFLGYILHVNGVAIAFRYGFVYGTTLFAVGTGYDPAYEAQAPGSVLFFESLRDIAQMKLQITMIDFMPHENAFKRDRANVALKVSNYYLFRRDLAGLSKFAPVAAVEFANRSVRRLRERRKAEAARPAPADD